MPEPTNTDSKPNPADAAADSPPALAISRIAAGVSEAEARLASLRAEIDDVRRAVEAQLRAADGLRSVDSSLAAQVETQRCRAEAAETDRAQLIGHIAARHAKDAAILSAVRAERIAVDDGRRTARLPEPESRDSGRAPSPKPSPEKSPDGRAGARRTSSAPNDGATDRTDAALGCETASEAARKLVRTDVQATTQRDDVAGRVSAEGPADASREPAASKPRKARFTPAHDLLADAARVAARIGGTAEAVLDGWLRAGRDRDPRLAVGERTGRAASNGRGESAPNVVPFGRKPPDAPPP